ncbi:MAG: M23 family metallopeptidase [Firmicutes bacterium]|nr:M23 family metallopeptidase [Bacillota bacterium]
MRYRRRQAPVSTLRAKLQQRLEERADDGDDLLGDQFAPAEPSFPVSVLQTMHRYFLLKLAGAAVLILLAAVLVKSGYSGGAPLLQALRFVVEWDLEPGALPEKAVPSFKLLLERLELPALKPQALLPAWREPLPLAGTLVSGFGLRTDAASGRETMHYGIDLAAPGGTAVRALQGGRVEQVGADREGGVVIVIATAPGWTMLYRGLQTSAVEEGEIIEEGARLGVLAGADRYEQPHLHFELRFQGRPVAPPPSWTDSFRTPVERI